MAARIDCTGKCGLPLSKKTEKSFGSQFMTNRTDHAKNAGEVHFLVSAIHAQKMACLYGEAGIINRQSTLRFTIGHGSGCPESRRTTLLYAFYENKLRKPS
jgi:hypothetical protein